VLKLRRPRSALTGEDKKLKKGGGRQEMDGEEFIEAPLRRESSLKSNVRSLGGRGGKASRRNNVQRSYAG